MYHGFSPDEIHRRARFEYCIEWYWAAFKGTLKGIEIRTRSGNNADIKRALATESRQPGELSMERAAMEHFGTHHQKPILIDFLHAEGTKAIGYVMGLNSVTDYWDTSEHELESLLRELEAMRSYNPDPAFESMKPYRDYACRIDGGHALVALYNNFIKAWERADPDRSRYTKSELGSRPIPSKFLKPAPFGSPQVQIVRTQPEENDTSIKEAYFQATDQAANAQGYLYLENQYFQHEEWAQRLLKVRKQTMDQWNRSRIRAGLSVEEMPIMHVFIVIPVPEDPDMIPRTYDTLATLGQQKHMDGQSALIKKSNEQPHHTHNATGGMGPPIDLISSKPEVVQYANKIDKPSVTALESQFGIKVCTVMLNANGSDGKRFKYREIYIHSKLLLVDDIYFTLGSANLNQRSMVVDSEINIATIDPVCATDLRRRVWENLTGSLDGNGGDGSRASIATAFRIWVETMDANSAAKKTGMRLKGFILPLADGRSSTSRVG